MLGCLLSAVLLFAGCSSFDSDQEDDVIIITDKGLDIDDDKKFEKPNDTPGMPSQPGDAKEEVKDTITTEEIQGSTPEEGMPTLYIDSYYEVDSTLFKEMGDPIESHIVIRSGGKLQILEEHTMHQDATITIEQGGHLEVYGLSGCLRQVELTVKEGGIVEFLRSGSIWLKSREHLHLESGCIILCDGRPMNNEGLGFYISSTAPNSSGFEKLDSLEIQSKINY